MDFCSVLLRQRLKSRSRFRQWDYGDLNVALTWSHASGPSGPQTMRTQRVKIHVGVWNTSFASGGSQDLDSTTFLLQPALHLEPPLLCL